MKHWRGNKGFRKFRSAFTLIELLVVVSIIALLVSILLPSLSSARTQARMVICSSNQRMIIIAAIAYQAENEGKYPRNLGVDESHNPPTGIWPNKITRDWDGDGEALSFGEHVSDYLGNSVNYDVLVCPLTRVDKQVYENNKLNYESGSFIWVYGSYAFYWNYSLRPTMAEDHFIGPGVKSSNSSRLLTSDLLGYQGGLWSTAHPSKGVQTENSFAGGVAWQSPWERPPADIFPLKVNVGCTDASVSVVDTQDVRAVTFEYGYAGQVFMGIPEWAISRNPAM